MASDLIGQQLGHIRIESSLGAGGMGEVFLGYDEKLQRKVALKTIRGVRRLDPDARGRFVREARILSKLDHPGICRIYNLIEYADCDFLVLEYIEGCTLTRLMGDGALQADRKLPVAEGIALVLAAAHAAGVAHRDLKPDNVMVCPDGQVKILDFGLSRLLVPGASPDGAEASAAIPAEAPLSVKSLSASNEVSGLGGGSGDAPLPVDGEEDAALTQQGHIFGTPGYMSPEQARGQPVGEKSDLYSLGVILHELFVGKKPYPDDLTTLEMLVRVQQGMVEPATGIDAELAILIDQLKSENPQRRPSAEAAARTLAGIIARPARRRARRRRLAAAMGAITAVILAVWLTWLMTRPSLTLVQKPGGRIAVLPFVDRTGRQAWVRTGLRDLVVKPLDGLPAANLVPLEQVEEALQARNWEQGGRLTDEQVKALRDALGAEVAVEAWIDREGEEYRLSYRVSLAETRAERQLRGGDLPLLGDRMAQMLAEELRLGSLRAASRDPFALQLYGVGVHTLRTKGAKSARPLFESCLVIDPGFSRARLSLAECAEQLGTWAEGIAQAEQVRKEAAAGYDAGMEAEALVFLAGLAATRSDYAKAAESLERALALEKQRGDLSGQAGALFQLARVSYLKGDWDHARTLLGQTLELERRTHDLPRESDTVNYLGLVALNTRDFDLARRYFTEVQRQAEERGDQRRRAMSFVNLGNVANHQKRSAEAETLWIQALQAFRGCGDRHNETVVLNNLGVLKLKAKNYEAAEGIYRDLANLCAALGDRVMEAAADLNRAMALMALGRLEEAAKCLERVVALETWVRDDPECLATRAELAFLQGQPGEAVRLMEAACRRGGPQWAEGAKSDLERYRKGPRVTPYPATTGRK